MLERNSPAMHQLDRLLDEAHRFAITYHQAYSSKRAEFRLRNSRVGKSVSVSFLTPSLHWMHTRRGTWRPRFHPGLDARTGRRCNDYIHSRAGAEANG